MKRAIIIPTYSEHFKYVKDFLHTYQNNVCDQENIDINIIVSDDNEKRQMDAIISNYKIKNLYTWSIMDILSTYGINFDHTNIIDILGKFSYQTIKKLYAIHYLQYDQSLILDSETLICSKVNINKLFDNYFKSPYVFYSNISNDNEYKNSLDYKTSINIAKILNVDFDNCWYLEGFHWFYDIKILNDLFSYFDNNIFETIYNFAKTKKGFEKAVFECILYYRFIRTNNTKYDYQYINSTEILKCQIKEKELQRISNKMIARKCQFLPFTIHGFEFGKVRNINIWARFLKKYKCQIIRLYPMKDKKKLYIIKRMLYVFNTKIICSTDNVGMYKHIALSKCNFSLPFLFSEDCNQW